MGDRLKGRVAVVIGAARGIGAGIAERFIEEGGCVIIGDTEREAGLATAKALGGDAKARFCFVDVTKPEDIAKAVSDAITQYGLSLIHI